MRPDPKQLRDPFGCPGSIQHHGSVQRIGQSLVQVVQHEPEALYRD
jgi:hypothetical protein